MAPREMENRNDSKRMFWMRIQYACLGMGEATAEKKEHSTSINITYLST